MALPVTAEILELFPKPQLSKSKTWWCWETLCLFSMCTLKIQQLLCFLTSLSLSLSLTLSLSHPPPLPPTPFGWTNRCASRAKSPCCWAQIQEETAMVVNQHPKSVTWGQGGLSLFFPVYRSSPTALRWNVHVCAKCPCSQNGCVLA